MLNLKNVFHFYFFAHEYQLELYFPTSCLSLLIELYDFFGIYKMLLLLQNLLQTFMYLFRKHKLTFTMSHTVSW